MKYDFDYDAKYNMIYIMLIGLLYNMFFHQFANLYYKDQNFENRYNNTIVMLSFVGVLGIVIGKLYLYKYFNDTMTNGIFLGGILLLISVIINTWKHMEGVTKLILIAALLAITIKYSHTNKK